MRSSSDRQTWTVLVLLALGFTIAYIDRTNLSIALASPEFKSAFSLSDSERGLLNSAFFLELRAASNSRGISYRPAWCAIAVCGQFSVMESRFSSHCFCRLAWTPFRLAIAAWSRRGDCNTGQHAMDNYQHCRPPSRVCGLGLTTAITGHLLRRWFLEAPSAASPVFRILRQISPAITGWLIQVTGSYDAPMGAILFVLLCGIASYSLLVTEAVSKKQFRNGW